MKIALACDWYPPRVGGIERHLSQLAARLAAAGHAITVLTSTPGDQQAADAPGVSVIRIPAARLPWAGLAWNPGAFRRLGESVRGGGFDVVHAHSSIVSPMAYASVRHAARAGLPAVLTVHSTWDRFRPLFRGLAALSGWPRWPVAFSAVGERVAREVRPFVAPRPVHVLPNAVDPAEWNLELHPPDEVFTVVSVMRLAPRKRGTALLRAARRLRDALPAGQQARFEIVGDGPERDSLERLARRLGMSDRVRFHGTLPPAGVKAMLARSHVFALPTHLEAFGLAALEARAAGLPVVAMRDSGVAEFIVHDESGLLAADDEDFARQLIALCNDRARCARLTAHNRRTPVAFTWGRTLAAHLALYRAAGAPVRV